MRREVRAALASTLSTVAMAVLVSAAAAETYTPPWFSWVESQPDYIKNYVTRTSEVVDWIPSSRHAVCGPTWPLSSWVRAAKYIVYVAPRYDLPADPATVYRIGEGSNIRVEHRAWDDWGRLVRVHEERYYVDVNGREGELSCPVDQVPKWRAIKWGKASEDEFARRVINDNRDRGKVFNKNSEMFKAAVRIAYWVASWIPYGHYRTPDDVKWWMFTPLDVLRDPTRSDPNRPYSKVRPNEKGWNCAGHAVLAAALMRALGIPVRAVHGTLVGYDGHYWVEFFCEPGVMDDDKSWIDVDPNGNKGEWYSEFGSRIGPDCTDVEAEDGWVDDWATSLHKIESEWLNIGVRRWEEPMPVSVLALVLALAALMARRRRVSA